MSTGRTAEQDLPGRKAFQAKTEQMDKTARTAEKGQLASRACRGRLASRVSHQQCKW